MSAIDTAKAVLAKASLLDQSFANPDLGIAVAWAEVLGDVSAADAVQVVASHYATETRRIMPADVLAGVRRIRAQRLREMGNEEPEYDRDDVLAGLEAIRRHRKAIADGQPVPKPRPLPGTPRPEDVVKRMNETLAKLPQMPPATPQPDDPNRRELGRVNHRPPVPPAGTKIGATT